MGGEKVKVKLTSLFTKRKKKRKYADNLSLTAYDGAFVREI